MLDAQLFKILKNLREFAMQLDRKKLQGVFQFSLLACAITLAGCGSSSNKNKDTTPAEPLEEFSGSWQQSGTGRVWQFSKTDFIQYDRNTAGCVLNEQKKLSQVKGLADYLSIRDQKLNFDNDATDSWLFEKLDELPQDCREGNRLSATSPQDSFEFFWHHFNDYYAFFATRDINWQEVYQFYKPQISADATPERLATILGDMVDLFDDSHVAVSDGKDLDADGGNLKGLGLEVLKYLVREGVDDISSVLEPAYNQQLQGRDQLLKNYFPEQKLITHPDSNAMEWAVTSDNVGYLRINRESSILAMQEEDSDSLVQILLDSTQDLKDTDVLMQAAMVDLADTDAIIIDLRINSGGYDKVSQKIASYFNDEQREFAVKGIHNKSFVAEPKTLSINAREDAYHKPVYVVTGQNAVSAGEVLALALNSIPHVTTVGQPTNGSISDSLRFRLPNGWRGSLSHEVYRTLEDTLVEGTGVMPKELTSVYAPVDLRYGSDTAMDKILLMLDKTAARDMNRVTFSQFLESTRQELNIPGMAVAIVHDGEIVFEQGYGVSNLETQQPVSSHTPFNIGSTSKAVLGTAIMQKVEGGELELDMPVANMNLPFDLAHPEASDDITLRHLVTHTSGIADDEMFYECNYYIHGTDLSLSAQFGNPNCNEVAITDPTDFYTAYFQREDGSLNLEVFVNPNPGQRRWYTNIGTGLAAYAIERHLNINLANDMQTNLFVPLGMHNTHWHHTELSADNPKAVQYTMTKEGDILAVPEFSYATFYDGDLNASAHDLARLMMAMAQGGALEGERVLKPESVQKMFAGQWHMPDFGAQSQGIFWRNDGDFIGHDGSDPGTTTLMNYNHVTKTGYVLLVNLNDDTFGADELESDLEDLTQTIYRVGLTGAQ